MDHYCLAMKAPSDCQREVNVTKRPCFNEECLHVPTSEEVTSLDGEGDDYEEERIKEWHRSDISLISGIIPIALLIILNWTNVTERNQDLDTNTATECNLLLAVEVSDCAFGEFYEENLCLIKLLMPDVCIVLLSMLIFSVPYVRCLLCSQCEEHT